MLHAYDQRFDVTRNLKNFCELNKYYYSMALFSEVISQCSSVSLVLPLLFMLTSWLVALKAKVSRSQR